MDDSTYPLAQADRAFAYDGAYRTPNAMSAASRAAYGMHGRTSRNESLGFRQALHRATAGPRSAGSVISARGRARAAISSQPHAHGPARIGAPPGTADPARAGRIAVPSRAIARHPSSAYYLFVSSRGTIVRAIVWRGRAFAGGVRTCPTSTL